MESFLFFKSSFLDVSVWLFRDEKSFLYLSFALLLGSQLSEGHNVQRSLLLEGCYSVHVLSELYGNCLQHVHACQTKLANKFHIT